MLPWWARLFLRRGFRHVLAFSQAGPHAVIVIDPVAAHLYAGLRYHPLGIEHIYSADFVAVDFTQHGARVVKITYDRPHGPISYHPSFFYPGCVTIAKYLLGLKSWLMTPYQLYKLVMDKGGHEFTDSECKAIIKELEDRYYGRRE